MVAKEKQNTGTGKKCRSCGLDCVINRELAIVDVVDSKKLEKLKLMYGDTKPAYNPKNCKKR